MNIRSWTVGAGAALTAAALLLGPAALAQQTPVTIPVILPLTGGGAFIGQTHEKTMQILQDMVNKNGGIKGRPLKFDFLDDQTSPAVSKQLATQVQSQSPIVLGSSLSAMCQAILPVYETNGPVQWCLSPAVYPATGSYVFSTSVSTKDLFVATLRFFREKGWKKFALLASQDASGQDGVDDTALAMKLPENSGMQLVDTERYAASDVSATAQVTRIKAAGPQALIIWVPGTPFATGLRAMQDVGLDVPVVATSANMVVAQLKQYSAFMPKELYFPGVTYAAGIAQNARVKHQQDLYQAAMKAAGVTTDLQSGMTWDAGLMTVDALQHLGPTATGAQVRNYIAGQSNFAGILGIYNFQAVPQRGTDINDAVMQLWNGNGWTTASSFGGALK
ncbi:MAG TPA: ABC transporter substrate-binding protein [Candidatus Lustribacter sp.]|jgi:branched-chain amino acid transport system substrate-binding protein|nr:ABC transporter substrate-binding protein [Candidatus Lustribacter sp.]